MSVIDFLLFLLIAGIIGAIAGSLIGFRSSFALCIVFGFLGAIAGRYLASYFGLPEWFSVNTGSYTFPLVWSILGAMVVVGVFSLVFRRRYYVP